MSEKIDKALKHLENAEIRVLIRGKKIVKILAQKVELQEKDGVRTILDIPADINLE